jgi:hypothetical protein
VGDGQRIKPGCVIRRHNDPTIKNPTIVLRQLLKTSPIPFCEDHKKWQAKKDSDPKTQADFRSPCRMSSHLISVPVDPVEWTHVGSVCAPRN